MNSLELMGIVMFGIGLLYFPLGDLVTQLKRIADALEKKSEN